MIELLETFGNDLTIVNAARVSFQKESTEMCGRDEKLIHYLADHNHNSPFFHPQLRFRIKMPIFVAREWFRHTIGFARNEVSRRYVDTPPELWYPTEFRERDPNLKQGSKDTVVESPIVKEAYDQAMRDSMKAYYSLLANNVAPEIARAVLPMSLYTEFIETGSLAAYARLCKLRLDPHAQKEIQEYAQQVSDLIEKAFPVAWKALLKDV
jgi:thymidylate synthase (FAD)